MYGKLNDNRIEYAPTNYKTDEGNLILNFNKNEQLMMQYGYKIVIKQIPEYDIDKEEIYEKEYIESEDSITIIYETLRIEPTDIQIAVDRLIELEQTTELLNSQMKGANLEIRTNKKIVKEINEYISENEFRVNELNSTVNDLQLQQNNYDKILSEEVNK